MINELKHLSKLSLKIQELFSIDEIKNLMDNQLITSYHVNNKPYYYKPNELQSELNQLVNEKKKIKLDVIPILVDDCEKNIPFEIQSIKDKLVYLPCHFISAIYFLCKDNKVVYVGQAVNVAGRVSNHFNSKDFDSVFYIPIPKNKLNDIERQFIKLLKPIYNKTHNS